MGGFDAQRFPIASIEDIELGMRMRRGGARPLIPEGARRIDLPGMTILPGLIDMHVHLFFEGDPMKARLLALSRDDADEFDDADRDKLFREAAEVVIQHQQGSTSLLQRRLGVGYGRAARIIDQLHHAGVLGPPDGSKPREVLVGMESIDHICGD